MNADTVLDIGQQALWTATLLAAPILLTALGVGLFIGIIQAATQIQEMTLSFIPKLLGVALAIIVAGPWMLALLQGWVKDFFTSIPMLIG